MVPGKVFHSEGKASPHFRVSFASANDADMSSGMVRERAPVMDHGWGERLGAKRGVTVAKGGASYLAPSVRSLLNSIAGASWSTPPQPLKGALRVQIVSRSPRALCGWHGCGRRQLLNFLVFLMYLMLPHG